MRNYCSQDYNQIWSILCESSLNYNNIWISAFHPLVSVSYEFGKITRIQFYCMGITFRRGIQEWIYYLDDANIHSQTFKMSALTHCEKRPFNWIVIYCHEQDKESFGFSLLDFCAKTKYLIDLQGRWTKPARLLVSYSELVEKKVGSGDWTGGNEKKLSKQFL